jgi:hypothetical protein
MKPLKPSLSLSICFLLFMATNAWAATLTHGPLVGTVTPTSATVFVRTDQATNGFVRVVCCPYPLDTPFTTAAGTDFTALVPVSGMVPGVSYTIQVFIGNDTVPQTSTSTFKAFPAASSRLPFLFGHITDFAGPTQSPATPGRVFELLAAENPAFVLIGGDFDHRNPGQGLPPE